MAESYDCTIAYRAASSVRDAFNERSITLGREPADMHRELVKAFGDGRITITPTAVQDAANQELYQ